MRRLRDKQFVWCFRWNYSYIYNIYIYILLFLYQSIPMSVWVEFLAHQTLIFGYKDAIVVLDQHLGEVIHSPDIEVLNIGSQQAGTPYDGQVRGGHTIRSTRRGDAVREQRENGLIILHCISKITHISITINCWEHWQTAGHRAGLNMSKDKWVQPIIYSSICSTLIILS